MVEDVPPYFVKLAKRFAFWLLWGVKPPAIARLLGTTFCKGTALVMASAA